jgi:hypothetical protein
VCGEASDEACRHGEWLRWAGGMRTEAATVTHRGNGRKSGEGVRQRAEGITGRRGKLTVVD